MGMFRNIIRRIRRQPCVLDRRVVNDSNSIGYAGIQLLKGKILVIDNMLPETNSMVIKAKYVIAHTPNVEIRWASETRAQRRGNGRNQNNNEAAMPEMNFRDELAFSKMSQIRSKMEKVPDKKELAKEIIKYIKDGKTMSGLYKTGLPMARELIFIQSQSNFIEKNLGQGERMKIRNECLVGYASTV
jgi:hypothetical protein